ncbi:MULTISPECIES: LysE family translocator [Aneurinibacillus]|uniref:LysE family translocator n=1 Tax=Aneurinibacillus thermoaerophilus TaxID=143495 RepID=A0A1G8A4C5_ANETH|nr:MULTISPECIES: LysE family translocator [Aneurinibacillus]AMA74117.1 lysine transporter LysE [Aneurinibacillus sp. XH2]MED0675496.1 LysE family translocator [Aneurinibacillus thermoaerophilus]MED0738809.1 LysE family translocator [Aneurinibacillus thermoaerophilus]MED0758379.1 LysE family translocator [Aneurinibacillus thermoaerophilus]MED0759814.1 LysE family translocator [Aneurinibacillus thermoaerophilus]
MGNFYLFVITSILLIILPGPDTGLATQNTIAYGKKGGIKTVLGISTGLIIHTLAAVFGLSAIIVKSALLFSIFKYVGAIYLIYLGITSLWSLKKKREVSSNDDIQAKYQNKSPFRQGFLTNLLNPKIAIFFLTFLPQFLTSGSNPFLQFLIMGITYTVLTIIWFLLYVNLIDSISVWMKKTSTQRVIQGISGLVLVAFGIKLALERRP